MESVFVCVVTLFKCPVDFSKGSLQGRDGVVWPSAFPLSGQDFLHVPQTLPNLGLVGRIELEVGCGGAAAAGSLVLRSSLRRPRYSH